MKRIKEIIDNCYCITFRNKDNNNISYYADEVQTAIQIYNQTHNDFKAYAIHLLQTGFDVIIGEQDYTKFKERLFIHKGDTANLEDYRDKLSALPCNNPDDVKILPIPELITLSGVFCDGKWHEEFIVSKYGIEHIRELK